GRDAGVLERSSRICRQRDREGVVLDPGRTDESDSFLIGGYEHCGAEGALIGPKAVSKPAGNLGSPYGQRKPASNGICVGNWSRTHGHRIGQGRSQSFRFVARRNAARDRQTVTSHNEIRETFSHELVYIPAVQLDCGASVNNVAGENLICEFGVKTTRSARGQKSRSWDCWIGTAEHVVADVKWSRVALENYSQWHRVAESIHGAQRGRSVGRLPGLPYASVAVERSHVHKLVVRVDRRRTRQS